MSAVAASASTTSSPSGWVARARRFLAHRLFSVLAVVLTVAIVFLLVYPIGSMVVRELFPSGSLNSEAVTRVIHDPLFWESVRNTVIIVIVAGLLSLVIGSAFAWFNERTDARIGWVAGTLPLLPLVLPNIALVIGWIFLAERSVGMLNGLARHVLGLVGIHPETGPLDIMSWSGMIFLYTMWLVSFVYILVAAALRNVDPALEEAARISGASPWRTFRDVSLRSIQPALGGACFLILMLGVANFSTGRTIGVTARIPVLSVYIVNLVRGYPPHADSAVFCGMMLLAFMMLAYFFERKITRRHGYATVSGKSSSPTVVRLGPFRWIARGIMILYLAIGSIVPFAALLVVALQPYWSPDINFSEMSLENYRQFFEDDLFRSALKHSLQLAVSGATIAVLIAAWLVSYARTSGSEMTPRVVEGVARAPGAISHIVLAVAFLLVLGASPFNLANTVWILLLAYILMHLPQAWITSGQGLDQIGQPLLDASAISGASRFRTFFRVNLPLMAGSLTAGWAMLFVVMVGDLTASAILAGPNSPVVGNVILIIYDNGTYSDLAALATTIAVIAGTVVTLVMLAARRAGPSSRVITVA